MKILFVAMSESIHTVRWVRQIKNQGWDLYIFPAYDNRGVHNELTGINICIPYYPFIQWLNKVGLGKVFAFLYARFVLYQTKYSPDYYSKRLQKYIQRIQPDLIHSLETQGAGYLVARVKCDYLFNHSFPVWWHTNWGSDISLFGRMPAHQPLIKRVVENCNYYSCECKRDVELAKQFGLKGTVFPVYPNTGGLDAKLVRNVLTATEPTSKRKLIMLKGYQGWAGRALVAIRALERCADIITGYTIVIYSNAEGVDVAIAAELLSQNAGVTVTILPGNTPHQEILRYHSLARVSIGLSISDAISTSLLEAMSMGAFPVQSCTACASEWVTNGVSGLIVPPEDPEIIEIALRKALTDDYLVDSAAQINVNKIIEDANFEELQKITIQSYQTVFNQLTK